MKLFLIINFLIKSFFFNPSLYTLSIAYTLAAGLNYSSITYTILAIIRFKLSPPVVSEINIYLIIRKIGNI